MDSITPDEVMTAVQAERKLRAEGRVSIMSPGEINREVTTAIARHIQPDRIGRVISGMLDATRTLKDGTELPDTRTQEAAVKLYLSYMIGLPTQRVETVNVNLDADSAVGLRERLQHSPALRKTLAGLLREVEDLPVEQ
jgi:hypothetical protein